MNNAYAAFAGKRIKTRFTSIVINENDTFGVQLGNGACLGVILKANHFILNTQNNQVTNIPAYFYYGDAHQQSFEYLINTGAAANVNTRSSELILCQDLSEVFVRFPTTFTEGAIEIQIMIFEEQD